MRDALYIIAIVTGALLYLAPTIVAHVRRHHYRWPITAINVLLGMTVIAWLVCLVWAIWPPDPSRPEIVPETNTSEAKPVKLTKM